MASLVMELMKRYPDDDAVKLLRKQFDKAVTDGDCAEYICTKSGCKNRTNE